MKGAPRSSSPMSHLSFAMLGVLLLLPAPTRAADQTVLGSKMTVQDTGLPEKRKVQVSAKEKGTDNTIVGNPVADGATLNIHLSGGPVAGQTFNLAAGTSPMTGKAFWSGDATKGFTYQDSKGEHGAVAKLQMSNKKGTFQIKVSISGKLGTINILPPNPGADGCALLTIGGGGDSYSVNFASGVASNKGATLFKISKPTQQATCIRPNPNNLPIDHIVVMMQENRSADTYFAQLSTQGQPGYEVEPNTGNPDPTNPLNPPIVPFHKTSYCEVADLNHSWKGTHQEVNNGLMNGFTAANVNGSDPTGSRTMGYYDQTDLPFYYGLFGTFATGDRYFASLQSQTDPNRLFLLAGTSFGYIHNDILGKLPGPSVFNLLDQASVTWRIYAFQYPDAYGSTYFQYVTDHFQHVRPIADYFTDLANGNLPNVAFIDPSFTGSPKTQNDEHPISNVQVGQKFVADNINALMASSAWATSAVFLTWDEHGGFYDHVVPPPAVPPDAIVLKYGPGDPHELLDEYGIRVPLVAVSPYAKSNFVSHVVHDHTSILKFIETRFGLPSLTARDAAADPMLELFDFNTATFATPPSLPTAVIDSAQLAACPG